MESQDLSLPIHFSDEEDGPDDSQLVKVSEGTYRLLKTVCMRNDLRRRMQSVYKFPKVEATRTPKVDEVIISLASQSAKTADRTIENPDLRAGLHCTCVILIRTIIPG